MGEENLVKWGRVVGVVVVVVVVRNLGRYEKVRVKLDCLPV
jgi:hypothetical protein